MRAGSLHRAHTTALPVCTSPDCTPCVTLGTDVLTTGARPHDASTVPEAAPITNRRRVITPQRYHHSLAERCTRAFHRRTAASVGARHATTIASASSTPVARGAL